MARGTEKAIAVNTSEVISAKSRRLFWSKVNRIRGGCWLWTGALNTYMYGQLTINKYDCTAHRISWILKHGKIPIGLWVLHKCDVPNCVRVSHLFLGTAKDNATDRVSKNRSASGDRHPLRLRPELAARGSANGCSKLTERRVRLIRAKCLGYYDVSKYAKRFKVAITTIRNARAKKTWRHV